MGNFRLASLAVLAVGVLSGCGTSDADKARELAVERMSTVPLPPDYVLVDSIVEDMDTNAFTRQSGSVTGYWETDRAVGPDNFIRVDAALVGVGFRRYQSRPTVCGDLGVQLGYARRDLDIQVSYGFAEGQLSGHTNFSDASADYNYLDSPHDWLDELPACAGEGAP